jgi:hypothetical protein
MADLSIIEFAVYGALGYGGLVILMISSLINPPTSTSLAGARSVWLMPSVLSMIMLMFISGIVPITEQSSTFTTVANDTSTVWTETGDVDIQIILVNPIWGAIHFGFFLILILYIVQQIVNTLRSKD